MPTTVSLRLRVRLRRGGGLEFSTAQRGIQTCKCNLFCFNHLAKLGQYVLCACVLLIIIIICMCVCVCEYNVCVLLLLVLALVRNGQWYQHLQTLFAIFHESNTEGTNFRIMFKYVLVFYICKMCMFCICKFVFSLCKI